MSRKHNGRHPERGRSRYRDRLARRGTAQVAMPGLDDLRATHAARERRNGHPWPLAADRDGEQS
jgi:hypothetical protein